MSFEPYNPSSFCGGADVISVQCGRIYLNGLKHLLWPSHWRQVDVQVDGKEEVDWQPEISWLEFTVTGLKAVARLGHDPDAQFLLWKSAKDVLERLMNQGWHIHAGATANVLAIVLTKRNVTNVDAQVEWDSAPELRSRRLIDDVGDGLQPL